MEVGKSGSTRKSESWGQKSGAGCINPSLPPPPPAAFVGVVTNKPGIMIWACPAYQRAALSVHTAQALATWPVSTSIAHAKSRWVSS
ncbi:MAG: hypothetical protein ACHQHN_06125 [Sphingobacteriales bacterium]